MLKYQKDQVWTGIQCLVLSATLKFYSPAPFFTNLLVVWMLIVLARLLYRMIDGAIHIQRNYFIESVLAVSAEKKEICLSFDDGIHPERTPRVLDILYREKVPALFFIIGKNIPGNEIILKRMHHEGHTLGNHSDQHGFWFDLLPARSMLREIKKVNQRIQQLLEPDFTVQYIRPPYGVTNPSLSRAIQKCGMISVGWNLRSYDTITRDPEELLHTLKSETKPGSLVLLHDRCESTVQVLTNYIHFCKEQGYTFTTL